jgi:ATP-binding cassette subfamily C protein
MLLLMLYAGLHWWQLPLPMLATLVFIFSRLMPMAMQVQQQLQQWSFHLAALTATTELLAECRQHAEPAGHADSLPLRASLALDNVTYTYPGRDWPALHDVSLSIPAGSTVAVIGSSGSGKSTLADVLMGLLLPDSGQLRVDGQILDQTGCQRWRRGVAYVPQDCFLFNDSIRHNLLWADDQASDEQLWRALDQAAAGFVRQLPAGLDTVVGDQGLRLSGGERQRIALARALMGRPALLILDEATSALDTANEELIRQAIVNLHGQLTVIAIGHRLATLQHADLVIVMEQGRVVSQGSWAQLQG